MNKKIKILLIILIIVSLVIGGIIFIKIQIEDNNDTKHNSQLSNELMDTYLNNEEISQNDYVEKYEFIKGIVSYISKDGHMYISNTYSINTYGMAINEYSAFSKSIFIPNDVKIINYYNSEEMKLEEISEYDIVLFNAKISYPKEHEEYIVHIVQNANVTISDNNLFILHRSDLNNMLLEKYKGEKILKDIKIVQTVDYEDKNNNYTYIYAQMKFQTPKNDELVYCFNLQLSDNTIIENNPTSKYADIILEDNFENVTDSINCGMCRNVYKITYK